MIAWLPVLAAVALGWGLDRLFAGGAAVYVLPLASGAIALALYSWRRRPRGASVLAAIVALAIVARYLQQWNPEGFWGTTLDVNSRAAFERIRQLAPGHPPRPVRVGGSWLFEPSVNFYRQARHATWMAPYERVARPVAEDYDFFICQAEEARGLERRGWSIAYRDPVAGVTFMSRTPPS